MRPKYNYIRSKRLMEAYRLIPCQNCGADDGTVCGAHSNWGMGKGMGIKATDLCASLCHACHMAVDQGRSMSRVERETVWNNAHLKTIQELNKLDLWPEAFTI